MNDYKKIAKDILKRGWQPVIIPKGGKHPIMKGWQDRVWTEKEIDNWTPCNVAINLNLSPGLACFDIDRHGVDGFETLAGLDIELSKDCYQDTPNKGRHVFYKADQLEKMALNGSGVEFRHGKTCVVVYGETPAGTYEYPDFDDLPEMGEAELKLIDWLRERKKQQQGQRQAFYNKANSFVDPGGPIPEGQRHDTLYSRARNSLMNFGGPNKAARESFQGLCGRCVPPMPEDETERIWADATAYYHNVIEKGPRYNRPQDFSFVLNGVLYSTGEDGYLHVEAIADVQPKETPILGHVNDYLPYPQTDLGQSDVFSKMTRYQLAWNPGMKWLYFNGVFWEMDQEAKAMVLAKELCRRQVSQTDKALERAEENLAAVQKKLEIADPTKLKGNAELDKALEDVAKAKSNNAFAKKFESANRVMANLQLAAPEVFVDVSAFDKDPYLLNTPRGVIDLKTGLISPHAPMQRLMKCTAVSMSDQGRELWGAFIDKVTGGDKDLAKYLQLVCGRAISGEVEQDGIVIFFGDGANGKSTFLQTLVHVLGSYASVVKSKILTHDDRQTDARLEDLKGLRLAVTEEMKRGLRLDEGLLKEVGSSGIINCDPKNRRPYSFKATHSLFVDLNNLPEVTEQDRGTWRRITVVPFNVPIRSTEEVSNYKYILQKQAGGYVLKWLVDGCRECLSNGGKIVLPESVKRMTEQYREDNDQIKRFLSNCCDFGPGLYVYSSQLYEKYNAWCSDCGEKPKEQLKFIEELKSRGLKSVHRNKGSKYEGFSVRGYTIERGAVRMTGDR